MNEEEIDLDILSAGREKDAMVLTLPLNAEGRLRAMYTHGCHYRQIFQNPAHIIQRTNYSDLTLSRNS